MRQSSIFEFMYDAYKITKPVRIIELFAGYGSQHLALSYLGVDVKGHKIVEWAVPSIQAYKDLHYGDVNTDHTKELTDDEIINELLNYGISANYNEPMKKEQIKRRGSQWCRNVYNNIKNTNNLVNISNVKATDLEITETDKYDYILTYSFPCQDLSLAGKRAGMDEDSETRSSLLWQVQRLLDELQQLNQLPQVLLMENVPQVISQDNMRNMEKWDAFLSSLGYKSYIKNLIATDYGIPQIRNRTFMISILGEYSYTFPKPIPLELKLSDMLEDDVDEKYYLSNKMIDAFSAHHDKYPRKERFIQALKNPNENDVANTITARAGQRPTDNFIVENNNTDNVKDPRNLKEKLCDDLIESGTVKGGEIINHSYTNSEKKQNSRLELENFIERTDGIMPTLTTRPDILGVVVKGIATNESEKWAKKPLDELSRTLLANKSNAEVGVMIPGELRYDEGIRTFKDDTMGTIRTKDGGGDKIVITSPPLRIRKITPLEAFRLMGVKDDDYYKIAKNQSNSSLYHLAGDSIVVNVLIAIFKQLL